MHQYVDNESANRQIEKILAMHRVGVDPKLIAAQMNADGDAKIYGSAEWIETDISEIIDAFAFSTTRAPAKVKDTPILVILLGVCISIFILILILLLVPILWHQAPHDQKTEAITHEETDASNTKPPSEPIITNKINTPVEKKQTNQPFKVWGTYERENAIPDFSGKKENWTWHVIIVKPGTSGQQLVNIAKEIYKTLPAKRVRIFDDTEQLQQYINRDIYVNDTTGKAREVSFPEQWTKKHYVATINDRSNVSNGNWQLVSRYGEHIYTFEPFDGPPPNGR